jgi:hypothetical protein
VCLCFQLCTLMCSPLQHAPILELKRRYSKFECVDVLVDSAYSAISKREAMNAVLWAFLAGGDGEPDYCVLQLQDGALVEQRLSAGSTVSGWSNVSSTAQQQLYKCFSALLSLWSWSGSVSCAHGLSPIDWDVVAALESAEAVSRLNAKQLLTLQKAKEFKETHKVYAPFLPPPPTLKVLEGSLVRASMAVRAEGGLSPSHPGASRMDVLSFSISSSIRYLLFSTPC